MKKTSLFITILVIAFSASRAQQMLTPDSAIRLALKNNYDILTARATADIDRANNKAGNAGMLPSVGITATDDFSLSNQADQHFSDGSSSSNTNTQANSYAAGISLKWTLFDGGKMFVTKRKLNEIESLGEIQFRDKVLQTLYDVYAGYYNVVKQKEQLNAVKEVIRFNEERVSLLQASFNAGLAPKNDLLQAKIDLNVYQESAISQETVILAAKRQLNQLLGRDPEVFFDVIDSIKIDFRPDPDELAKKLFSSNTAFLTSQKQVAVAGLGIKELKRLYLPSLDFSAGYGFTHGDYTIGSVRLNEYYGPVLGATLFIPLYQSGNISRQVSVARLQFESAQFNLENTRLQVNTQFRLALTDFDNQMRLLKIERENLVLARENLGISMHRLELGQTTALEVRQAQESFQQSLTRLTNFEYSAKVAEIKVKQLMAAL
ncbi:MAG: TolC family protein [Bacteroidetes bacterium]|nr:TolC family protein [Bacteroidota bacterium]